MIHIVLGVVGFLIAFAFDHPYIDMRPWAKLPTGLIAFGLLGYSFVMVTADPSTFAFPLAVSTVAWALTALFTLLFIYSVFIEIPFNQAYLGRGGQLRVVKTGTYAITRHPGVLWAFAGLACLFLASGTKLLLVASPIWLLMDLIWVYLQDRFYFPKTIAGYEDYKGEVPMLIPTGASLRKGLRTLGRRDRNDTEVTSGRNA